MRKLKLQVQMSVDGFIAGPEGGLGWMTSDWDDELSTFVDDLTKPVDTILLGRNMTDGFISYWTKAAANPDSAEHAFGKKMMETPKIVFSRTMDESPWENTRIAESNLKEEINALKKKKGGDIIAYGGASFVSSLINAGLIDEHYLFVNPSVLGHGLSIFKGQKEQKHFSLLEARAFACGIVLLKYGPLRV